jgi:collagen beta-1,O-galactosyltransferase
VCVYPHFRPIVAPLLIVMKDAAYSNFWGGQNENGYYVRTQEYISILKGKKQGCFKVPVVHSTFLIDLRTKASEGLAYWPPPDNYKWDIDDIIIFSFSARKSGMGMYVLTTEFFGYLKMPGEYSSLAEAINQAVNWKLKTIVNHVPIPASEFITRDNSTPTDTVGMDKVILISLERRPERRQRMFACLNELEINFELFNAIDGKQLNQSYLDELGIHYLPGWKDPWGERPMTFGEVGCFLSHYFIWLKMIAEEINTVLILEDDVDFEPNFKQNVLHTLEEVERVNSNWDLVYVGRKPLVPDSEVIIPNTTNLVIPSYSYWTLGYIISLRGARKLVTARPLDNLLPVDEFIPIMFNRHTETEWVNFFSNRNLEAYSVNPLIIFPTHYVGDPEWFSDTEPPPHILEQIRLRKVAEQEKAAIDTNGNDMKDEL